MENSGIIDDSIMENDFSERDIEFDNARDTYADFKNNPAKAIKLIDYRNGRFIINKEKIDFIRSIEEELIIILFTGKCKTGNSYILNLLLNSNVHQKPYFLVKIFKLNNLSV